MNKQLRKNSKQKGFTLIELMIVVAVIGVLSAIAVPQYQNYVKRSAAGAALSTAKALQTNVEEYIAFDYVFPANSAAIRASNFSIGTVLVEQDGDTSSSGKIEVEVTEGGGTGAKIVLTRTADASAASWACVLSGVGITLTGCGS